MCLANGDCKRAVFTQASEEAATLLSATGKVQVQDLHMRFYKTHHGEIFTYQIQGILGVVG